MNIGFIGFGTMGQPMAEHLLQGRARPACLEPPCRQRRLCRGAGCAALRSVRGGGRQRIVCTNVTGSADVEGPGRATAARPGAGRDPRRLFHHRARRRPAHRGAPCGAASISSMRRCRAAASAPATPRWPSCGAASGAGAAPGADLSVLGKTIVRIGEVGAGQVAKACNQMVLVAAIEACAEAARLAEAAGVDFAWCARPCSAARPVRACSTSSAGAWRRATLPPASKRACTTRTTRC
jgi:2-hydroxy-3-oxopropionate reductase